MTDPRPVTVTMTALRTLTVREIVQACRVTGVRRAEVPALITQATDPSGDPDETARAVDLLWAMTWQYVRRSDPGATWDDAKTWDVRVEGTPADVAAADDLAMLRVEAAVLAGVSPAQADQITLEELDAYALVRAGGDH